SFSDLGVLENRRGTSIFRKFYSWMQFRNKTKKLLSQFDFDFLYIGTVDTAIALRWLFEKKYRYFFHIREMYDQFPHYMRLLKLPAQNAYRVIVPEENRAFLYFSFLKLLVVPEIIPNKSYDHPRHKQM